MRAWQSAAAAIVVFTVSPGVFGEGLAVLTNGEDRAVTQTIVRGEWGAQPGQFGREDEAARTGPTDFTVVGDALYVLDPVNARVQVFDLDGGFVREIPIGTRTADFLCVDDAGDITVLDAFVNREFITFSPEGDLLVRAKVPASVGLCSAIWADGDRVWIEERHSRVHEIVTRTDRNGPRAAVAATLPGRPIGREGGTLHARKSGAEEVVLKDMARRRLWFDRPVMSIVALECDARGRVYVAVTVPAGDGEDAWTTDIVLAVIEAGGEVVSSIRMPNAYATDHYRKLCVSRSGEIIQMQTTEEGVRFVRWLPQASPRKGVTR
jgi:hypothetical protein